MTLALGSLTIRSAKRRDLPILAYLAMESYADAFGHSLTREELLWQLENNKSSVYFSERIETDAILLAILQSRMVGYIQITDVTLPVASAHPADQQLNSIYVAGEYQGRGIGRRLMERALKLPRVKSAPHLYLDVWNENTRALEFYAGFGFQVIGETDVVVNSRIIGKDLIMRTALPVAREGARARLKETRQAQES
jgi:ribosomal protein S18 acetylase RimI-like enzyme